MSGHLHTRLSVLSRHGVETIERAAWERKNPCSSLVAHKAMSVKKEKDLSRGTLSPSCVHGWVEE